MLAQSQLSSFCFFLIPKQRNNSLRQKHIPISSSDSVLFLDFLVFLPISVNVDASACQLHIINHRIRENLKIKRRARPMQIHCSCNRISCHCHWVLRVNPPRATFLHKNKDSTALITSAKIIMRLATIIYGQCHPIIWGNKKGLLFVNKCGFLHEPLSLHLEANRWPNAITKLV